MDGWMDTPLVLSTVRPLQPAREPARRPITEVTGPVLRIHNGPQADGIALSTRLRHLPRRARTADHSPTFLCLGQFTPPDADATQLDRRIAKDQPRFLPILDKNWLFLNMRR